jgi:DNA-3-methyladenine glycosylase
MSRALPSRFYQRPTETVARELLGCILVHEIRRKNKIQRISGRIVETEAYLGTEDPACHTFEGRCTPRNAAMYLPGGHSYVYFIYGMHFCFNVVTRTERHPEAVLIRALEPLEGLDFMRRQRAIRGPDRNLTNGPAKLCEALAIDRSCNGLSLVDSALKIEKSSMPPPAESILASPRVGVSYAGAAAEWRLRFSIENDPFVSKPFPNRNRI